jgi:hypothetical protein
MKSEDWKVARVSLKTADLPPIDNVNLAKGVNEMVYYKYLRGAAYESDKTKRTSESVTHENLYLMAKVKALEAERGVLESKLVSLGKDT